jgi:putative endonuclease
MPSSRDKGNWGEDKAIDYLMHNGYMILERNFRTRYGEIDIIGEEDGYIAFIEVKTRRGKGLGMPCEAVDGRKQKRIARMALLYTMIKHMSERNLRFDVLEIVTGCDGRDYIHLIKDAFQVDYIY